MKILSTIILLLVSLLSYAQLEWSGYGTCFALTSDGYLATNEHVIAREGYQAGYIVIPIIREDGTDLYRADIVATDKENDLAILKIQADVDLGLIPYSFKTAEHEVGEKVYNLGYPRMDIQGVEVKLNDGIINAQSGMLGTNTQYQTNIAVYPGNSGGPVIGINGNVIGVVNSNLKESDETFESSVTWVIKTKLLLAMCKDYGIELPTENTLAGKELPKQVAELKHLIYIVFAVDSEATLKESELFADVEIIENMPITNEPTEVIETNYKEAIESETKEEMPEITAENILTIFESENTNIVIQSESGMEIDRFTVADYLKRIRLLKRHQPQVVDQKVNGDGKIIELIIKENSK